MIQFPPSYKPKVTRTDVVNGFIKRYFTTTASNNVIYEISKETYDSYKTNPYFQVIELVWIISGTDENTKSTEETIIFGARHQNEKIIEYYNKKMPGLKRKLKNPLEFFNGKIVGS